MKRFCLLFSCLLAPVLSGATIDLTVLFTSDTHAYFDTAQGGWLKLASLIKTEAVNHDKTLLIDCGDTLQGTLEGAYDKGAAVIKTMNHLSYDAWIIGNHDTEFGFPALAQRAAEFKGLTMGGNLVLPGGSQPYASWRMFNKSGLKTAVIGMTLPNMHDDIRYAPEISAKSLNINESVRKIIPAVRQEKPDVIILAMHAPQRSFKFSVYELSKEFPEIGLVIGAHSHKSAPGEKVGSAWYVQTGAHARQLGKVKINYDTAKRQIVNIDSELLPVTAQTQKDQELCELLADDLEAFNNFKNREVGYVEGKLDVSEQNRLNPPLGHLLARAMSEATQAPLALLSVTTSSRLHGKITEADLHRAMPYENTVPVITVSVAELKEIIQEQLSRNSGYYVAVFRGLKVTLTGRKNNVFAIYDPDMRKLDDSRQYQMAVANYLLISNRFPKLQKIAGKNKLTNRTGDPLLRDCLRDYIRKNSPVSNLNEIWLITQ